MNDEVFDALKTFFSWHALQGVYPSNDAIYQGLLREEECLAMYELTPEEKYKATFLLKCEVAPEEIATVFTYDRLKAIQQEMKEGVTAEIFDLLFSL